MGRCEGTMKAQAYTVVLGEAVRANDKVASDVAEEPGRLAFLESLLDALDKRRRAQRRRRLRGGLKSSR